MDNAGALLRRDAGEKPSVELLKQRKFAVRAFVDKAREDGTPLSPDAVKAAVMASLTDAEANSAIEINIEVEQAPRP